LLEQYFAWAAARARFPMARRADSSPQQIDGVARHGIHVADIGQKSADAMLDHFRHSSGAGGNGDDFTGHAFQCRQSEGFQFAGHQHHV
jgi:hypothetical protein